MLNTVHVGYDNTQHLPRTLLCSLLYTVACHYTDRFYFKTRIYGMRIETVFMICRVNA